MPAIGATPSGAASVVVPMANVHDVLGRLLSSSRAFIFSALVTVPGWALKTADQRLYQAKASGRNAMM